MDLREYEHITKQPDTYPRSTLLEMRRVLESIGSSAVDSFDQILKTGYLDPPNDYTYHGFYRVNLTSDEKEYVLEELQRAWDDLAAKLDSRTPPDASDELAYRGQLVEYWERTISHEPIPWEIAKQQQTYFNLRTATLSAFENFIFDHEVPKSDGDTWYYDWNLWVEFDSENIAELYIQLFKASATLLKRYSPKQLEQGCEAMSSQGVDWSVHSLIWESEIGTDAKVRLIESMFDLYANVFSSNPLYTMCEMWWDPLAYDFNPMKRADPQANEEHRRIQDAMFRTLTRILKLESPDCQRGALHGLNHVFHPDTKTVIDAYVRQNPNLSEEMREYALACSRGEMM